MKNRWDTGRGTKDTTIWKNNQCHSTLSSQLSSASPASSSLSFASFRHLRDLRVSSSSLPFAFKARQVDPQFRHRVALDILDELNLLLVLVEHLDVDAER